MRLEFKNHIYPGKLITFCGIDGSGKTTMIGLLEKYLISKGYKCVLVKQPSEEIRHNALFRASIDLPYSENIDYRALSMLCAADKLQHSTKTIEPMLKDGYIVISDRYIYSSLANLSAYGFQQESWFYEIVKHIVKPDVAFFLSVPTGTAIKRVRERTHEKNRYINVDLQNKLSEAYSKIALANDGFIIDCDNSVGESFEMVRQFSNRRLK